MKKTCTLIAVLLFIIGLVMGANEEEMTPGNFVGLAIATASGLYILFHLDSLDDKEERRRR